MPKARLNKDISKIFAILQQQNPEPKTELEYTNNFTLLVAVVLSAQATDKGVNKATKALFAVADTPQKMYDLGEDKIRDYIKTIGLFNSKAKNVYTLCKQLLDKHNGQVPADFKQLTSLAGVGNKTANVILNCAFGMPTMAVDTHIYRLAHRLNFAKGKTPDKVSDELVKNIPAQYLLHAHHWLILHGRYVCIARKPKCSQCIIADYCPSKVI